MTATNSSESLSWATSLLVSRGGRDTLPQAFDQLVELGGEGVGVGAGEPADLDHGTARSGAVACRDRPDPEPPPANEQRQAQPQHDPAGRNEGQTLTGVLRDLEGRPLRRPRVGDAGAVGQRPGLAG